MPLIIIAPDIDVALTNVIGAGAGPAVSNVPPPDHPLDKLKDQFQVAAKAGNGSNKMHDMAENPIVLMNFIVAEFTT